MGARLSRLRHCAQRFANLEGLFMPHRDALEALVDLLYEAAFEVGKWPLFLAALAQMLEGTLPTLFLHNTQAHSGALSIHAGYDTATVRSYQERFAERNVWLRGGLHLLQPGHVRTSHMMCSRAEFLRSEWYSDYCRPLGISQGIGATILKDATTTSNIAVFAGEGRADYDEDSKGILTFLMPHLQRAMRVHTRIADVDLRKGELLEALERLATGVILVTASAQVVFMNSAARSLVNAGDGLKVEHGVLNALRLQETSKLRRLIGGAAETTARKGFESGGILRISRSNGRKQLEAVVSPISLADTASLAQRAVAALYITDPAQDLTDVLSLLVKLHGLTRAEAKAAAAIVSDPGKSARRIADELGVSYNTLKTQLKRAYAKTGACGQGQLIRLILCGIGQINWNAAASEPAEPKRPDRRG
jgi:DNA-binding CsgD family transcriptional regulator